MCAPWPTRDGLTGTVTATAAAHLERALMPLLLAVIALAVVVPGPGRSLEWAVLPLFALMMGAVSVTFDLAAVRASVGRGRGIALCLAAVYVPTALLGYAVGLALFGPGPLAVGMCLLGALPTDISAPLFAAVARGSAALAAVLNAADTSVAPLVLPPLVVWITGVVVPVPAVQLVGEMLLVVVAPSVLGVAWRTVRPAMARHDPTARALAVVGYLALIWIVVSGQAGPIRALGGSVWLLGVGALCVIATGYGLGFVVWRLARGSASDLPAYLFALGEKEFAIAAVAVYAGRLDHAVLLPSLAAAVLQAVVAAVVAMRLSAAPRQADA